MTWRKVKIGDFLIEREGRYSPDNPEISHLKRIEKINFSGEIILSNKSSRTKMILVKGGDLVISGINVYKGALAIYQGKEDVTATIHYSSYQYDKNIIDINYLKWFLKSKTFLNLIKEQVVGGIKTEIKPKHLLPLQINLPNLDEQKIITNRFEKSNDEYKQLLNEISHQQTLIKKLKQSILQDAIQGKLTEEWRNSIFKSHPELASGSQKSVTLEDGSVYEPASVLLQKIKAEKDKLIAEGKIKKGKKQTSNELNNNAITLPHHWCIVDLDDITLYITDGTHQTPSYTSEGKMFLSAQNVKPFKFMPEKHRCISEEAYQRYIKNRLVEFEDILIGRVGAGIGETAVVDKKLEFAIYVSLGLVKTFKKFSNPNYLAIVFNSPYGVKYSKGNISSGGGSAGNFNLGRIRSFPIPLPPLIEQKLIVEKLDKLMNKINLLEKQIEQNKTNAEMLIQAVLKEAFEEKS